MGKIIYVSDLIFLPHVMYFISKVYIPNIMKTKQQTQYPKSNILKLDGKIKISQKNVKGPMLSILLGKGGWHLAVLPDTKGASIKTTVAWVEAQALYQIRERWNYAQHWHVSFSDYHPELSIGKKDCYLYTV